VIFINFPIQNFTKIRPDTNQLTNAARRTEMTKPKAVSRQFIERTQTDLHVLQHTFPHIKYSDMTTSQTFRHVLPSVYQRSVVSELQTILLTIFKMIHSILPSTLTAYAEVTICHHPGGFRHNSSPPVHIFTFVKYLRKRGNSIKHFIGSL